MDRLLGFWQIARWNTTPILSSWYTEYYSQEDRLKALAKRTAMSDQYATMTMLKVNALMDIIEDLEERVKELEG